MPVDEALLEAHASYRDERLGISERFVRLRAGGARTWGVLSLPTGERRSPSWLICHSFGLEQIDLHMTDVAFARALAAAGHPVLRFHCQGYGDADDVATPPTPSSHLRDTLEVAEQMPGLCGDQDLALVGSRFGAAVAALAAQRLGASRAVMAAPVVSGSRYAAELLRARVFSELMGDTPHQAVTMKDMKAAMASEGLVNVKGWPLHRTVYEELGRFDLLKGLERFTGRALVLQVSRSPEPQKGLVRLLDRLREVGARASLETVTHTAAPNFGYEHFRPVAKDLLGDVTAGINQGLCERVLGWLGDEDGGQGAA